VAASQLCGLEERGEKATFQHLPNEVSNGIKESILGCKEGGKTTTTTAATATTTTTTTTRYNKTVKLSTF
jgi:hypothetical protein